MGVKGVCVPEDGHNIKVALWRVFKGKGSFSVPKFSDQERGVPVG